VNNIFKIAGCSSSRVDVEQMNILPNKVLIPDVPFIIPVHTVALDCPIRLANDALSYIFLSTSRCQSIEKARRYKINLADEHNSFYTGSDPLEE
jgi:hypothetical protein